MAPVGSAEPGAFEGPVQWKKRATFRTGPGDGDILLERGAAARDGEDRLRG
jgi:hypothetical protein